MAFVETQNAVTVKELEGQPEFAEFKAEALAILNSHDRIPFVHKLGEWYYNFWQDAANPRGLFRRTTLEEYRKPQPAWETVLDVDALAKEEKENWVWAGEHALPPKYERTLVSLSRGGGDAKVVREFDLKTKTFVADGFSLPEAKSESTWRDENTIFVGTEFGPGSLTDSGYPRIVKRWLRGTPLSAAETVFEGEKTDVSGRRLGLTTPRAFSARVYDRGIAFYNSETFLVRDGKNVKLDVPNDASPHLFRQWLAVRLRSDWTVGGKTYKSGSLIVTKLDDFLAGGRYVRRAVRTAAARALQGVASTLACARAQHKRQRSQPHRRSDAPANSGWTTRQMTLPGTGTASASAVDSDESDDLWVNYQDFLSPSPLYLTKSATIPASRLRRCPR